MTTPTGHTYDSTAPPLLPLAPPPPTQAAATLAPVTAPALFTVAFYHHTDIELELVA